MLSSCSSRLGVLFLLFGSLFLSLVSCQPCSLALNDTVTWTYPDTLFTIVAKQQAKFVFQYTTGDTIRVEVYGGPNAQATWVNNTGSNSTTASVTLRVDTYDLRGNGASRMGASNWLTTAATTTATSLLMWKSRHDHVTPLVLGAAASLAATQIAGADAASACSDPVVVITLPVLDKWGDRSRVFRMDVSQALVISSATCPAGEVWHGLYGCSALFHSIYQLQWSDPMNAASCGATLPQQVTITSAQGNYLTLDDMTPTNLMIPFTPSEQAGYGRISFNTTRDGEPVTVLAWIDPQQNRGFAAVTVTTPTRTCNAGYKFVAGLGYTAKTLGTRRCAHYTYQTNSTTCPRNLSPDYSACPSLSCDMWCPIEISDPCTSSCPATVVNEPVCRANGTCQCPGGGAVVSSAPLTATWSSAIMTAALGTLIMSCMGA